MAWFGKDRGASAMSEAAEPEDKFRRCISLLMEGIRLHTCSEDEPHAAQFNRLMRQMTTQLDSAKDHSEILAVITAVIDGMAQARRDSTALNNQTKEESKLLSRFLMTRLGESLSTLKANVEVEMLSKLGPEFERAKNPEEIKALREKLEYMFSPEPEKAAAKVEAPAPPPTPTWDEAAIEVETADSPTGLRGRAKAKERLTAVHGNGLPYYAVVFVLEGYSSLEERFGADAAQDCLIAASNYLLQALSGEDQLYHWDRYAFLGVITRETRPVDVTLDMMKICGARPQQSIRVGQRTILASMPIKPSVVAIQEFQEFGNLIQQIDQFARQGA